MPIRVLHCIHSLSGGGAERQLGIIANHASSVDISTGIFCVNSENHDIESDDCEILELKDHSRYPLRLVPEVTKAIRKFDPDIVHCWVPAPLIIPAMISAKLNGVPVVASFRSRRTFAGKYFYFEYLALKLFATAIISNNPIQTHPAWHKLFNSKINAYIPNAVLKPQLSKEPCPKSRDDAVKTILFIGRIYDTQKNWRCLLKAVANLNRPGRWRLQICGKGFAQEEKELQASIDELGLAANTEFLGFVDDVADVMSAADVLVLPSWYEGMPNVALEAMQVGLPCVLSDIPEHAELFGDKAGTMYFDPANPEKLASILSAMIDGEVDLRAMAQLGSDFSNQFTPKRMMAKTRDLYERVIDGGK